MMVIVKKPAVNFAGLQFGLYRFDVGHLGVCAVDRGRVRTRLVGLLLESLGDMLARHARD
jgi:hypothetical protein